MNQVIEAYLWNFVLINDILVYSPDLPTHIDYLSEILQTLRHHQLFAKKKKCAFGVAKVEYWKRIISGESAATNSAKIQVMLDWPTTTVVKSVRGFLGLTGYYRRFVKNYGIICKPLNSLLKKDQFKWEEEVEVAFNQTCSTM